MPESRNDRYPQLRRTDHRPAPAAAGAARLRAARRVAAQPEEPVAAATRPARRPMAPAAALPPSAVIRAPVPGVRSVRRAYARRKGRQTCLSARAARGQARTPAGMCAGLEEA